MAAGALPSGAAIAIGEAWAYRAVMVLSAALFIGCAVVCRTFGDGGRPAGAAQGGPSRGSVLRDRAFLRITVLYGALTMSALVLGLGVPLWVVQQTQAPAWTVTLVQVLNTAVVVALQVRISKGSEDFATARRMMRRGGLLSALAAGVVPLTAFGGTTTNLALVVAAALLFSLGELFIVSGTTGVALLHIPEGRKTGYLAAFNLGFAVTTVVGPPLITSSVGWGGWAWLGWAVYFTAVALATTRLPQPAPAAGKAPQTAGSPACAGRGSTGAGPEHSPLRGVPSSSDDTPQPICRCGRFADGVPDDSPPECGQRRGRRRSRRCGRPRRA